MFLQAKSFLGFFSHPFPISNERRNANLINEINPKNWTKLIVQ